MRPPGRHASSSFSSGRRYEKQNLKRRAWVSLSFSKDEFSGAEEDFSTGVRKRQQMSAPPIAVQVVQAWSSNPFFSRLISEAALKRGCVSTSVGKSCLAVSG